MICISQAKKYCREDISLIKGYAEAVADTNQTWICHHINAEPFTGFSKKDLKKMNMYLHRPASELRFVTPKEHWAIHKPGKETQFGNNQNFVPWNKGKTKADDSRLTRSPEAIAKAAESNRHKRKPYGTNKNKGRKWVLCANGKRHWISKEEECQE